MLGPETVPVGWWEPEPDLGLSTPQRGGDGGWSAAVPGIMGWLRG